MTGRDVIDLYLCLENLGVNIWIDGGWCVDALLGEQSRPHKDLDITIQQQEVSKLRDALLGRGYKDIKVEIARDWNFVLGDQHGREIDVHAIVLKDFRDVWALCGKFGIDLPPEYTRFKNPS